MPAGCIFADKGPAAFVANDENQALLALLSITNSEAFRALVELQMAFGSYEVGVIQRTPIPLLRGDDEPKLASLARRAWSLKRSLDARNESSHAFLLCALLQVQGNTVGSRAEAWAERVRVIEAELAEIQCDIDEWCFELYGIDAGDRRAISEGVGGVADGPKKPMGTPNQSRATSPRPRAKQTRSASSPSWCRGLSVWRLADLMCG